jgi:hypothetical protein
MTNFKQWLLTEEIDRNGKTAIVYHRTKKIENALGILQYGSKSDFDKDHPMLSDFDKDNQPGQMFFVFDLESTMGKAETYGNAIIKFKVTDLDKYLVFHTNMAKRIHGENYKLSDQLREFKISQKFTQNYLDDIDEKLVTNQYNHITDVYSFLIENEWIKSKIKGVIYWGYDDGYCLLKFRPVNDGTITMIGYATDPHKNYEKDGIIKSKNRMKDLEKSQNWTTSTDIAKLKSIDKTPYGQREKYIKIKEKNPTVLEIIKKLKLEKNIEKDELLKIMNSVKNKNAFAKIIIQNKKELTVDDISLLMKYSTDSWEICSFILKNRPELSDFISRAMFPKTYRPMDTQTSKVWSDYTSDPDRRPIDTKTGERPELSDFISRAMRSRK